MKHNRSNIFTSGICDVVNDDSNQRLCFFEIDELDLDVYRRVCDAYLVHHLDYLVHRTGAGWHWLSPTIVDKAKWKAFHQLLDYINPECPMTCLRWNPNKHPNESAIWYNNRQLYCKGRTHHNSIEMANLLNHTFHSAFLGDVSGTIKLVRYPLPITKLIEQQTINVDPESDFIMNGGIFAGDEAND